MSKHTPGPWQANFEHHARDNDAQFMVCRGDNHPLAVLSADGWVGIGERKANSRLSPPHLSCWMRWLWLLKALTPQKSRRSGTAENQFELPLQKQQESNHELHTTMQPGPQLRMQLPQPVQPHWRAA